MDNRDSNAELKEISNDIHNKELKIYENEIFNQYVTQECHRLKEKIKDINEAAEKMRKENEFLDKILAGMEKPIPIMKETLDLSHKSARALKKYVDKLKKERTERNEKYTAVVDKHQNTLIELKLAFEQDCQEYQELQKQQIELEKARIEKAVLDKQLENIKNGKKMLDSIRYKIFISKMVKFAEFYVLYHKLDKDRKLLAQKKEEERKLLKENFEKSQAKTKKKNINVLDTLEPSQEFDTIEHQLNLSPDSLLKEFNDYVNDLGSQPILEIEYTNPEKSKVKIIESTIIKPAINKVSEKEYKNSEKFIVKNAESIIIKSGIPKTYVDNKQKAVEKPRMQQQSQENLPNSQNSLLKEVVTKQLLSQNTISNEQTNNQASSGISQSICELNLSQKPSTSKVKTSSIQNTEANTSRFFNQKKSVNFSENQTITQPSPCNITFLESSGSNQGKDANKTFGSNADENSFRIFEQTELPSDNLSFLGLNGSPQGFQNNDMNETLEPNANEYTFKTSFAFGGGNEADLFGSVIAPDPTVNSNNPEGKMFSFGGFQSDFNMFP